MTYIYIIIYRLFIWPLGPASGKTPRKNVTIPLSNLPLHEHTEIEPGWMYIQKSIASLQ